MSEDSLKKRYAIKLIANIIMIIIGAVTIALVPKALGAVSYGNFVFLQNFFIKIIDFMDMGSSTAFFIKLSANHKRKELITYYFLYSLFVLFIILLFVFMTNKLNYTSTILPNIENEYIYMGLVFGFLTWITKTFIKISDAFALTVSVELIKIIHKTLSLLLLIYFIYFTAFDIGSYFYFNYLSLISFLLLLIWLFKKRGIFTKQIFSLNIGIKSLNVEFINYCSPLIVYTLLGVFVGIFDIWLLQKMAGSIQTGFYGLAYSLAAMCFIFTNAMTPIITREFAKSYEKKNILQMKKLFFKYIPMFYSIAAYFGIFISIQSENVLMIFTDEEFKDAYLVLVLMALYPINQTYGQLSGSVFYVTEQTKRIRNIALATQPIGLLLTFWLIYILELEAIGLAIKMLIMQIITVIIKLYFNSKFLDFKMGYFIWHQIYSLISFVILAYISSNIISFKEPLIDFLIAGIIYTTFVIIFTYIFPQIFSTSREEIKDVLRTLKRIINK